MAHSQRRGDKISAHRLSGPHIIHGLLYLSSKRGPFHGRQRPGTTDQGTLRQGLQNESVNTSKHKIATDSLQMIDN
ncbi:hypothetical protein M404DRAFT_1006459 [Pisolithus tinctorius Marx 270]|uniref:Uncharacterized protein n=1 Tax=Pisolithus tinctorius Marx 270 TaxID=870435 RepID=A0A0C3N7D1_PISTI|nr:hypothetical protein M404DRAFT_1006459 [Pisolithus tinctorius Marx 270]